MMIFVMKEHEALLIKEFESTLVANEAVRSVRQLLNIKDDCIHRTTWAIWNGNKWCRVKYTSVPEWARSYTDHTKHRFDYDRTVIHTKGK